MNKAIMKRRGIKLMGFAKLSTTIPSEKETKLLVRVIRRFKLGANSYVEKNSSS